MTELMVIMAKFPWTKFTIAYTPCKERHVFPLNLYEKLDIVDVPFLSGEETETQRTCNQWYRLHRFVGDSSVL